MTKNVKIALVIIVIIIAAWFVYNKFIKKQAPAVKAPAATPAAAAPADAPKVVTNLVNGLDADLMTDNLLINGGSGVKP